MLYGDNTFYISWPYQLRRCSELIKQHLLLVKHVSIQIGTEKGDKWKDYLLQHGEVILRQATRLTSVKITLLGNKARFKGRDCYGKVDHEHVKAIKGIANAVPRTALYGVVLRKTQAFQEKLRSVCLMPGNETIEGS